MPQIAALASMGFGEHLHLVNAFFFEKGVDK
jgi:hypothetical protein